MTNSEEEETVPLFAERPEWSDVVPVPQYETETPIAPILYSTECLYIIS
jgi:protein farnesyltransferase/geranylgeranyltransferase type-1 subunit alpha